MHDSVAALEIGDALTLKRAELWLEVGRPELALREVERLCKPAWGDPWAVRLLDAIRTASSQWTTAQAPNTFTATAAEPSVHLSP
jgi:hypothetical protein